VTDRGDEDLEFDEDVSPRLRRLLRNARLDLSDPLSHDMRNPHEDRVCAVCGGSEASLPTYCPGSKMDSGTEIDVMRGRIDFTGKMWTEL
jgi:hypothetical protein